MCTHVYYGKSQKLLGKTAEFKEHIPAPAVALVATGVSGLYFIHACVTEGTTDQECTSVSLVTWEPSGSE